MIHCSYQEVIEGLNSGKIKQVRFCINNYSHYKNCVITRTEYKIYNGESFAQINISLTKDSSERKALLNAFKEKDKLFDMGRKGKFTLKQLWPQITILEIVR